MITQQYIIQLSHVHCLQIQLNFVNKHIDHQLNSLTTANFTCLNFTSTCHFKTNILNTPCTCSIKHLVPQRVLGPSHFYTCDFKFRLNYPCNPTPIPLSFGLKTLSNVSVPDLGKCDSFWHIHLHLHRNDYQLQVCSLYDRSSNRMTLC